VFIPNIPIPEVKRSETVYKGYFEVREDLLQLPHGPKRIYTVLLNAPEAAVALAETPDGKLVLNKEYRHPTGKWLYGCPGGRVDPGESPLEAARRELLEETGYSTTEFQFLGTAYPFPAVSQQRIHYILAKNVALTHPTQHETFELIHVELKTLQELQEEIAKGGLIDGVLCTALFFRQMSLQSH
jgi:ADP-ribose pyrophosphatase